MTLAEAAEPTPAPLDERELRAWLRLLETPGVGRIGARKLLAACGSPEAVFTAAPAARAAVVSPGAAHSLAQAPAHLEALLTATLDWLSGSARRQIITLGDPRYPRQLYELADPPLLLYTQGEARLLQGLSLSIVGSRHPSSQGTENARAFAAALSQAGITVVSGLALGIDGAAHEGGLKGSGSTIAVVGTGLDQTYPRTHRTLAERIAESGLMLSEFALGTPPMAAHFPQRNRIIAGLSRGTLVVEAALKSGSLITARQAAEAGREVFAIPGSIHTPQARGCHALIKQGAKLVESTEDILEELHGLAPLEVRPLARRATAPANSQTPSAAQDLAEPDDPVLRALGHDATSLDALLMRTGWTSTELTVHLLTLELSGRIERLPGEQFQRIVRA
jgi:DNA processing protein